MKKIYLLSLLVVSCIGTYSQTCQNCGVNQANPQASLHVKGCGSTNATFGFKVSNALNKTALFVHDDLKVGIGAVSGAYQLEVSDTAASAGAQTVLRIANRYIATANNGAQLLFGLNRTTSGMTNVAGIAGVITDINSSAYKGALVFSTADNAAPVERLRIDHNGFVGIGTVTPYYKLEAIGDIYANQGALMTSMNVNEGGRVAIYNHLKTGREARVYIQYNMNSGYGNKYSLWSYSEDGTTNSERFNVWDNGDISFHDSTSLCRVMIKSTGNVGIGTVFPVANARLAIRDGHFQSQQTSAPSISITGASASLSNATDVAGKISITPLTSSTVADITFNKTYTTAPVVVLTPANAAAAAEMVSAQVFVTTSTSGFAINFGASPTTAEKLYNYVVIETE